MATCPGGSSVSGGGNVISQINQQYAIKNQSELFSNAPKGLPFDFEAGYENLVSNQKRYALEVKTGYFSNGIDKNTGKILPNATKMPEARLSARKASLSEMTEARSQVERFLKEKNPLERIRIKQTAGFQKFMNNYLERGIF